MAGFINSSGTDYHFKKINVSVDKLSTNSTYVSSIDNKDSKVEVVDLDGPSKIIVDNFCKNFVSSISNAMNLVNGSDQAVVEKSTVVEDLPQQHETTDVSNDHYDVYTPTEPVTYDDNSEGANFGEGTSFVVIPPNSYTPLLSGSCETKDYIIASYKNSDDSKQSIIIYSKKDNKPVKIFTSNDLGHCNGLTTDGERVYIANAKPSTKISSFSLKDVLKKNSIELLFSDDIVKVDNFSIGSDTGKVDTFTSIGYDAKSNNGKGVVAVCDAGTMYIVKNGKLIRSIKLEKNSRFADTNQDICVAKDSVYVIRSHVAGDGLDKKDGYKVLNGKHAADEYNVVDVYDTDGNYKYTKKIDIPVAKGDDGRVYRELESLSYDEATDTFTLYYNNPREGATAPHIIVRGVKMEGVSDVKGVPKLRSNYVDPE